MSLRAYARLRKVTPMAVSAAAKSRRLDKSVARDPATGRALGIIDPLLADLEWAANTDVSKAPAKEQQRAAERAPVIAKLRENMVAEGVEPPPVTAGDDLDFENAGAQAKFWDARLKELKYREAAAELVPAADVEREVRDMITHCKTRLLAIPSAARQQLPELSGEAMQLIEKLIREACDELAAPSLEAAESEIDE